MVGERDVTLDELSRVRASLKKYDVRREGATYVEESSFISAIKKSKDKNGKDDRLLVVSKSFIWVFKNDGKEMLLKKHLLDMRELMTDEPDEFKITFSDKTVLSGNSTHTDDLVARILFGVRFILPGLKPSEYPFKITILPQDRFPSNLDSKLLEGQQERETCGGFVQTYMSMTRRYDLEFLDSFIWEISNKYPMYHVRALDLDDVVECVSNIKDLQPMVETLKYNQYFRSISAKEYHIGTEGIGYIAEAMRGNTKIEKLCLVNVNAGKGEFNNLFEAMSSNAMCAVSHLEVPRNGAAIDDKAALSLANYIQKTMHGFTHIDLSYSDIKKNIVKILEAIVANSAALSSLTTLNLSHVDIGNTAGSVALQKLLASATNLKRLDLSCTGIALDVVSEGLTRQFNTLVSLDISGNIMPGKTGKSMGAPLFEKFLMTCKKLTELNLSDCKANGQSLIPLFSAMSKNTDLKGLSLNLSRNPIGSSITVLAAAFSTSSYICDLNLADCDLGDEGVFKLVGCLVKMTQLKRLNLDNAFKSHSKMRNKALAALVCLLDHEHALRRSCQLEHFSLCNTGSKGMDQYELAAFIERALCENEHLISLNISGHHAGDVPALSLGKNIPMACKLKRLILDSNDTSLQGLSALEMGIRRSYTMTEFPLPVSDIMEITKNTPVVYGCAGLSVGVLWGRIDKYLKRNANPTAVKATVETMSTFAPLTNTEQQNLTVCIMIMRLDRHHQGLLRNAEDSLKAKSKSAEEMSKKVPNATVIRGLFDGVVKEATKRVISMDSTCEQKLLEFHAQISDELATVYDEAVKQALALITDHDPATLGMTLEMTKRPLDAESLKADLVTESVNVLHVLNDKAMVSLSEAACDVTYSRVVEHLEGITVTQKALPAAPSRTKKAQRRSRRPDSVFATASPDTATFSMEDMDRVLDGIPE